LNNLMSNPASVWNVGASLTAPIFTAGAISGQVDVAKAQQQAALLSYQQTVQNAFKEVEDGLVNSYKGRDKIDAQQKQVTALRSYARFARMRYEGGYSSYLEVLDAERSLFNAELDFTRTQNDNFVRVISLYKALGGGWPEAEKLAPKPTLASNTQ
ncbi:MAG: TolC family protein, partial [Burkholderiales bacterium]